MTLRSVGIDRRLYGASVFTHWTLPPPPRHMIVCRLYNTHEPMHAHTVNKLKERRLGGERERGAMGGKQKKLDWEKKKKKKRTKPEEVRERNPNESAAAERWLVCLIGLGKKSQGPPAAWLDMSLSLAPIAPSPITHNP